MNDIPRGIPKKTFRVTQWPTLTPYLLANT